MDSTSASPTGQSREISGSGCQMQSNAGPPLNELPCAGAQFCAAHVGRFRPSIAKRMVHTVEVFAFERSDVGLRAAQMPA